MPTMLPERLVVSGHQPIVLKAQIGAHAMLTVVAVATVAIIDRTGLSFATGHVAHRRAVMNRPASRDHLIAGGPDTKIAGLSAARGREGHVPALDNRGIGQLFFFVTHFPCRECPLATPWYPMHPTSFLA